MNSAKVKIMLELARLWGMYETEGGKYRDVLEGDENHLFETLNDWADEYIKNKRTRVSVFFEGKLNELLDDDDNI